MTIEQYISRQEIERQNILSKIHFAILNADKTDDHRKILERVLHK